MTDELLIEKTVTATTLTLNRPGKADALDAALVEALSAAVGAGADLVLACGSRIVAPDAKFRMPGLKFELQLGTRRLAARIGGDAARALLATSKTFAAEEGLRTGFLHRIAAQSTWPGLIEAAAVADTRAQDLADLLRSASEPGLKERIREYRKG